MKKRILGLTVVFALLISLFPTTIQATGVNNSAIVAGDIVYYGTYPQTTLGKVGVAAAPLGTEGVDWLTSANVNDGSASYYYAILPIAWRVLENNNGELFMITEKNIVGGIPFHDVYGVSVTWETSYVRTFLNATSFLNQAFTTAEQAAVKSTQVVNDGNTTTDKVFLLSTAETQNTAYFADANAKTSTNTDYAAHKIAPNGYGVADYWWLRTVGSSANSACLIYNATGLLEAQGAGVTFWGGALRPAIKLDTTIAAPLHPRATVAIDSTYTFKDSSVKWTFEQDLASSFFRIKNNDSGLYLTKNNIVVNGVGKVIEMPLGNPNTQEWNIFWAGYYCIWGLGGGGESLTFYNGQLTYETHLWDNSARNIGQQWMHPGGTGIINGTVCNMKTYGYPDIYLATGKNTYTTTVYKTPVAVDNTYEFNDSSVKWTIEVDPVSSFARIKNNDSGLYLIRSVAVEGVEAVVETDKEICDAQLWNIFWTGSYYCIWGLAGGTEALTFYNGQLTCETALWDSSPKCLNQQWMYIAPGFVDGGSNFVKTYGSPDIYLATGKNTYAKYLALSGSSTYGLSTVGGTKFIYGVNPLTSAVDVLAQFNPNAYIQATTVPNQSYVGTGCEVKAVVNSQVMDTMTVLIYGDVDGTGDIGLTDLTAVKSHILNQTLLSGAYLAAADVTDGNSVTISDLMAIKKVLLGIGTISQSRIP